LCIYRAVYNIYVENVVKYICMYIFNNFFKSIKIERILRHIVSKLTVQTDVPLHCDDF
jgi:hypothetical protein